jgi:hypothetical protein
VDNKENKVSFKSRWADIKVWALNKCEYIRFHIKEIWERLVHDLKIDENYDLRLFVFVFVYLAFSLVGMYNFAHLAAFFYIIWLLERKV